MPPADVGEVARLVRLTAGHSPAPGDRTPAGAELWTAAAHRNLTAELAALVE